MTFARRVSHEKTKAHVLTYMRQKGKHLLKPSMRVSLVAQRCEPAELRPNAFRLLCPALGHDVA
jgi:hypothetical protein